MQDLLKFIDLIKAKFCIIFIYIQEAHADDFWPLGYGIKSPKTIEER